MAVSTRLQGIFQGDIILRTAVVMAIEDMRKNTWMLDYVFRSLADDTETASDYGQKEIDKAKEWFLNTNINVVSAHRRDDPKMPCISVALMASKEVEGERTLADIHYDIDEATDYRPVILGPLTPVSYSQATGLMVLPSTVVNDTVLTTRHVIVDAQGVEHAIEDVLDNVTVQIAAGTVANFNGMNVRSVSPSYKVTCESASFQETYMLGCHTRSEPYELLYLHALLVFALLRYNQSLFEGRGFERMTFSSSDLEQNQAFADGSVTSRFVTVNGYVRNSWPKQRVPTATGVVAMPMVVEQAGSYQISETELKNQSWMGEQDALSIGWVKTQ